MAARSEDTKGVINASRHICAILPERIDRHLKCRDLSIDKTYIEVLNAYHFRMCQQGVPLNIIRIRMEKMIAMMPGISKEAISIVLGLRRMGTSRL